MATESCTWNFPLSPSHWAWWQGQWLLPPFQEHSCPLHSQSYGQLCGNNAEKRLLGRILQKLPWERPWGLRPTTDSGRRAEWMSLDWYGRNVMVAPSATAKSIRKSLEIGRRKEHLVRFLSRRVSRRGGTEWFLPPLFTLTLRSVLESVTREFLVYLLNVPALPDPAALWEGMRFL